MLDNALSGFDGIALCRVIRQRSANADSAILIRATSAESVTVLALLNGDDDYMRKRLSIRQRKAGRPQVVTLLSQKILRLKPLLLNAS